MGKKLGLIVGSGDFPLSLLEEINRQGDRCVVAGVRGEASPAIEKNAEIFSWFQFPQTRELIDFFRGHGVNRVYLAGKIDPRKALDLGKWDETARQLIKELDDRSPTSLITALISYFAENGISVEAPRKIITSLFCPEGVLTKIPLSAGLNEDIAFGWDMAHRLSDLEVGQTLVVKNKTVVAVEGLEGTDQTILRGGDLAGPGTVVIKSSRTCQDMRIDLPAVGLSTVRHLVQAGSRGLCFEAERMPFFQKQDALQLAEENDISIIAKTRV